MTEPTENTPIVIRVETERVEGDIDLSEVVQIVRRVQEQAAVPAGETQDPPLGPAAARPAEAAGRRAAAPQELRQRLDSISQLAGQLADELALLPPVPTRQPESPEA